MKKTFTLFAMAAIISSASFAQYNHPGNKSYGNNRDRDVVVNNDRGTRFTPEKHAAQLSPFRHLLKPKSGGVAFVIDAMGDSLHAVLDVTIVYPGGRPSLVDLIGGRVPEVRVTIRERPIPDTLIGGDYQEDRAFRARFQQWMNGVWEEKDKEIARLSD